MAGASNLIKAGTTDRALGNLIHLVTCPKANGFRIRFFEPGLRTSYSPREVIEEEMEDLRLEIAYSVNFAGDMYEASCVLENIFEQYKNSMYWYECPLKVAIDWLDSLEELVESSRSFSEQLDSYDSLAIEERRSDLMFAPQVFSPPIIFWAQTLQGDRLNEAIPILKFFSAIPEIDNSGIADALLSKAILCGSKKLLLMSVEHGCNLDEAMTYCSRSSWRQLMQQIFAIGQRRNWNFNFSSAVKIAEKNRDSDTLKLLENFGATRSVRVQRIDVGLGVSAEGWEEICREYGPDSWPAEEE